MCVPAFITAVIKVTMTMFDVMVDEDMGAVEVCAQLDHRPEGIIVSATLTTQPLTATGINDSLRLFICA